ncbi:unnamed protein product [Symbiodinium pilosum]|uniref:Uncharacterized protein n=1 Tax=Symbiodinium pilosum TaxID=2952 RepID=A0A812Y9H0_SYMPI|nr:unnamed protein product [Symbiodinium pilosum]
MGLQQPLQGKIIPIKEDGDPSQLGDARKSSRTKPDSPRGAPPALLGKPLRPESDEFEGEADSFGLPYIRPSQHTEAGSVARGQFPSAAKQILHDLRHGVHDSKRRASAPAIHSLEFNSPGQARKRATVCAHPVAEIEPFEHPFAANRREETLSLDLLEVMEDHQKEQKDEPQEVGTVATGRSKTLAKQSSRISTATSSMRWRQPECTLIIVDWDDTIFPTSWLQKKGWFAQWVTSGKLGTFMVRDELDIPSNDLALMEELDTIMEAFLESACELGQVSCVTLARRPWQERTMRTFLPKLSTAWDKHFVVVRYAREEKSVHVDDCGFTPVDKEDYEVIRQVTYAKKKQKSMERLLRKFYKKGSWKNVISLGDGPAERQALQEIGFRHLNPASPKTGLHKSFRTKSVKMLEEPCCSELVAELQMLQAWLPALASLDEDIDIDLGEGEDALVDMHQQLMECVETCSRSSSPDSSKS